MSVTRSDTRHDHRFLPSSRASFLNSHLRTSRGSTQTSKPARNQHSVWFSSIPAQYSVAILSKETQFENHLQSSEDVLTKHCNHCPLHSILSQHSPFLSRLDQQLKRWRNLSKVVSHEMQPCSLNGVQLMMKLSPQSWHSTQTTGSAKVKLQSKKSNHRLARALNCSWKSSFKLSRLPQKLSWPILSCFVEVIRWNPTPTPS